MVSAILNLDAAADRDLERRVTSYLHERHLPGLRSLEVKADGGTVRLRGRVRSFYEKQVCSACCQRVAGVVRLIDAVEVLPFREAAFSQA